MPLKFSFWGLEAQWVKFQFSLPSNMTLTKTQFTQFPNPHQFKTLAIWQSFIVLQNTPFATSVCNIMWQKLEWEALIAKVNDTRASLSCYSQRCINWSCTLWEKQTDWLMSQQKLQRATTRQPLAFELFSLRSIQIPVTLGQFRGHTMAPDFTVKCSSQRRNVLQIICDFEKWTQHLLWYMALLIFIK